MGYGWIFTSNLSDNIKFSGSCKDWPSSSKAELMAILTALITCTLNSNVQIYTDSASCIDTFNKLNSPKLTARQFQKLNNCTIWNAVKCIINTLGLNVSLIKVKAHSDWEYSQLWFKYNSFSKPTSKQYTKYVSWKIKCSSNNLPMMDILNRNYPDLIKENEPCFLCSSHIETNEHLWNYPQGFTHFVFLDSLLMFEPFISSVVLLLE
ncbi:hypothetical protein RhiirA5_471922 [Rhizophagus irregularis]|uniref:RNase H type-1 domain-containing protein n=1 Tax=Rhizophagus irregularis TaxID=588596 RepID=A0A2I1F5B5_9GLOM|nr:hypothetical protein RhiirA5_471922 [Rhizophagus irregularis]PKC65141.1 hypothetical protein RhiirA1_395518 [Rhizophagus irregularis]PKY29565.1 hypothetical protein RhiirB3_483915 [Rhizophagus irregularis]